MKNFQRMIGIMIFLSLPFSLLADSNTAVSTDSTKPQPSPAEIAKFKKGLEAYKAKK
jgi:hypothetical protein